MPTILVDTSVLRTEGWQSAALSSLFELSKDGQVEIIIPDVVFEERRTQWRQDYKKKIADSARFLAAAAKDALLGDVEKAPIESAAAALAPANDPETLSNTVVSRYFDQAKAIIRPTEAAEHQEVMSRYFSGDDPFPEPKARKDIPDAYVYLAARNEQLKSGDLLVLCEDGNLRKAIQKIDGIEVFKTVQDLLESAPLVEALNKVELNKQWLAMKPAVSDEAIKVELMDFVSQNLGSLLEGAEVHSTAIPEDNNSAHVQMYGEPEGLEVIASKDFGSGWLEYKVSFEIDLHLWFYVYRSDAWDVPDWVSVSFGDPESEHYFEAEGERRAFVEVTISAQADVKDQFEEGDQVFEHLEFSSDLEITILDDE